MEYLTVRETSEKWGMSIRMVNYYLNTGRIEGAVRKKSECIRRIFFSYYQSEYI